MLYDEALPPGVQDWAGFSDHAFSQAEIISEILSATVCFYSEPELSLAEASAERRHVSDSTMSRGLAATVLLHCAVPVTEQTDPRSAQDHVQRGQEG